MSKFVSLFNEGRTEDPIIDVAAAVVRQAMLDYAHMCDKGKDTPEGTDAEHFLSSAYFTVLTLDTIDGVSLMKDIKRECERRKERKRRHEVCKG